MKMVPTNSEQRSKSELATHALPDRRRFLQSTAALGVSCSWAGSIRADENRPANALGLVSYSCQRRADWNKQQTPPRDLLEPLAVLRHCQSLGAGGMQIALGGLDDRRADELRAAAESTGMYIEATVTLPKSTADLERFAHDLRLA